MNLHKTRSLRPGARWAFTIPEYLVTIALVVIVSGGMLAGYIFAGRMYAAANTKLALTENVRFAMSQLTSDIRTATDFDIGSGTTTDFTPVATNSLRQGSALQIYPTTSPSNYVRYYVDAADRALKVRESDRTNVYTLLDCVTNAIVFTAEDSAGNVTTNEQAAEIIGITFQVDLPVFRSATNNRGGRTQFYLFRTRVNKRMTLGSQL